MNDIFGNYLSIMFFGKGIFNILNHVIFPAKIQIVNPIDASVFMYLRTINMSSECDTLEVPNLGNKNKIMFDQVMISICYLDVN
jgi:hypothetical protein